MTTSKEITKPEGQELEQASQRLVLTPPVDIFENKEEVLVVADVPGVAAEGLDLHFENNRLDIRASAAPASLEGAALFRELYDVEVDYRRSFELAPGIDVDKIKAELSGGTLTIHLPKSAALKPRQIPISAG